MAKMKRCPCCGALVSPVHLECPECEADLLCALLVECDANPPASENQLSMPLEQLCGCGGDLSAATPCSLPPQEAPDPAAASTPLAVLTSLDSACSIEIIRADDPVTIGRAHTGADYLRDHPYVSRAHATLVFSNGTLTITSLSKTNPTFINNSAMCCGEERSLCPGDEIGLGGCVISAMRQEEAAYFTVCMQEGESTCTSPGF